MYDKILVNSLPKSGTHLLAKSVELFGYKEYFSNDGYVPGTPRFFNYREIKNAGGQATGNDEKIMIGVLTPSYAKISAIRQWLELIPQNRYIMGHIPYSSLLNPILEQLNYRHLCIIRDPRAVIVSLISFIKNTRGMPERHFLEEDFKTLTYEQQLNFLLEGGYASKAGVQIHTFSEVYRMMLSWQTDSKCLMIRFEDLVGEQGGGSTERQHVVLKKIAEWLELENNRFSETMLKKIYNPSSRTFRTGKIDSWKETSDMKTISIINDYCKQLCIEAGYNDKS